MNKIVDYLKQLDLSDVEARLYLTLLQTGPTSVRDLAMTIEIKRTTAYFYIDQLVEKGLVMKVVQNSKKLVSPNEPDNLQYLVKKKVASANTAKDQLSDILSMINAKLPKTDTAEDAEIRYYKGILGIKKIYEEALKGSEFRLYVNLTKLEKLLIPNNLGIDYNMFETALAKNPKLTIYEIIADEPNSVGQFELDDTAQKENYRYKFMPGEVGLTAPGILLYDNKVAIINGKGQLNAVVLYNTDYYVNTVKLFDFIWKVLPETKGSKKHE